MFWKQIDRKCLTNLKFHVGVENFPKVLVSNLRQQAICSFLIRFGKVYLITSFIFLLLFFSGHSQDKSQSNGPEIEQAQVQPQ